MREMQAVDYSVKTAKRVAVMWGVVLILSFVNISVALLIPDTYWPAVAIQAAVLCIDVVMLRYALMKLARAKNNEWVHSMFEEWSR